MARKLNKKVDLTPPRRRRVTPGDIGEQNVAQQPSADGISEGDMVGVYSSLADHAANVRAFARDRIANECIDISQQPTLQKHLALMHLEDSIQRGTEASATMTEERDVEYVDNEGLRTSEENEFLADLDRDLRSVGLDTIPDALTTAPLTLNLFVLKNLPTQLCGSDVTMVYDRLQEAYAVGSLQEASALAEEEQAEPGDVFNPLNKWWILWSILMVFLVEFALLFAMKQIVGVFSRWPLKPIYRFLRGMVRKVLRTISNWVFKKIVGQSDEENDAFKQLQIQQVLLFAGGANPLVEIGKLVGIV